MNSNVTELLAEDISNRIGIPAQATQDIDEALQHSEEGLGDLPRAELVSTMSSDLETLTYEERSANGSIKQAPYDIDHIPTETKVATLIIAQTVQDTEDLAHTIRSTYSGNTDAGVLMLPIDENGTVAVTRYTAKQLRKPVTDRSSCAWTAIEPADGIAAPIPYPHTDLRASLDDRAAISRLLVTYFYYMSILESGVPKIISNEYSKLFAAPSKIGEAKKGLFNKLRENQFTANILDSGVAQKFSGETMSKLVDDLQAGKLNKGEFDAYFSAVIPVVPDLYDRALRREPADSVLAIATSTLDEVRQRAEDIANSLGIDENPEGDEHYKPRSLEAAEIYVRALDLDMRATAQDVIETYRAYAEEQAAAAQAQQEMISNMVADKIDEVGGGGIFARTISDTLRE